MLKNRKSTGVLLKCINISITVVFFVLGLMSISFSQTPEQITLTTYYPSPQGSYVELRARRAAIGDNFISPTYCWAPAACANVIDANADLVVEGNVGIGIENPVARLEVSDGTTVNSYQRMFVVHGNSGGTLHTAAFYNNLNYGLVLGAEDSDQFGSIDAGQFVNGELATVGNLILEREGANVGIGIRVPTAKLHVWNDTGYTEIRNENTSPTGGVDLHFKADVAEFSFGVGGSMNGANASKFFIAKTPGIRFVIDDAGNVGIGMLFPTHLLELNGGAFSDGITWTPASDKAYKKDIDYNFKYGLNVVEQLKPSYYVHKKDKTNKKQIGFIAQDVLDVIPEAVAGKEGSYGLNYGQLTAVLVNALKEQQGQINDLKQELSKLKIKDNAKE